MLYQLSYPSLEQRSSGYPECLPTIESSWQRSHSCEVGRPSGLSGQFYALINLGAWVQIPLQAVFSLLKVLHFWNPVTQKRHNTKKFSGDCDIWLGFSQTQVSRKRAKKIPRLGVIPRLLGPQQEVVAPIPGRRTFGHESKPWSKSN